MSPARRRRYQERRLGGISAFAATSMQEHFTKRYLRGTSPSAWSFVAPLSGCWNHGSQSRVFAPLDPGLPSLDRCAGSVPGGEQRSCVATVDPSNCPSPHPRLLPAKKMALLGEGRSQNNPVEGLPAAKQTLGQVPREQT